MKIILIDGAQHSGTPFEIVHSMTRRDHEAINPDHYMELVLARIKESYGIEIYFRNEREFLMELKRVGLIYRMEE